MATDDAPDLQWSTTTEKIKVEDKPDRIDEVYDFATKSQTHMWIVTTVHSVGQETLDRIAAGDTSSSLMLDAESLLMMPMVGCYVCEESYSPKLRHRKCKGEPKSSRRR